MDAQQLKELLKKYLTVQVDISHKNYKTFVEVTVKFDGEIIDSDKNYFDDKDYINNDN